MSSIVKVGFTSSSGVLPRLIKWATKSKVNHTFLYISDSFLGIDMVLQATIGGFNLLTYSKYAKSNHVVKIVDLAHPVDVGLKEASLWLGERYDYGGLFGSAFVLLGRWFKRKWSNPWDNSDAMFCSEAIVRVLQASNYPGSQGLDPSAVTPQDLLVFLTLRETPEKSGS
jgi:hypothetical protein